MDGAAAQGVAGGVDDRRRGDVVASCEGEVQRDEIDLGIRPPQSAEADRGAARPREPVGRDRRIGSQRRRGGDHQPARGRERPGRVDVERQQAPLQRGGIRMHQELGDGQPLSERRAGARVPAGQRQVDRSSPGARTLRPDRRA